MAHHANTLFRSPREVPESQTGISSSTDHNRALWPPDPSTSASKRQKASKQLRVTDEADLPCHRVWNAAQANLARAVSDESLPARSGAEIQRFHGPCDLRPSPLVPLSPRVRRRKALNFQLNDEETSDERPTAEHNRAAKWRGQRQLQLKTQYQVSAITCSEGPRRSIPCRRRERHRPWPLTTRQPA